MDVINGEYWLQMVSHKGDKVLFRLWLANSVRRHYLATKDIQSKCAQYWTSSRIRFTNYIHSITAELSYQQRWHGYQIAVVEGRCVVYYYERDQPISSFLAPLLCSRHLNLWMWLSGLELRLGIWDGWLGSCGLASLFLEIFSFLNFSSEADWILRLTLPILSLNLLWAMSDCILALSLMSSTRCFSRDSRNSSDLLMFCLARLSRSWICWSWRWFSFWDQLLQDLFCSLLTMFCCLGSKGLVSLACERDDRPAGAILLRLPCWMLLPLKCRLLSLRLSARDCCSLQLLKILWVNPPIPDLPQNICANGLSLLRYK